MQREEGAGADRLEASGPHGRVVGAERQEQEALGRVARAAASPAPARRARAASSRRGRRRGPPAAGKTRRGARSGRGRATPSPATARPHNGPRRMRRRRLGPLEPELGVGGAGLGDLDLPRAKAERPGADRVELSRPRVLDQSLVAPAQPPHRRFRRRTRARRAPRRAPSASRPVRGRRLREERGDEAMHRLGAGIDYAGDVLAVAPVGRQAHQDSVQLSRAGRDGARGDGVVLEHPGRS